MCVYLNESRWTGLILPLFHKSMRTRRHIPFEWGTDTQGERDASSKRPQWIWHKHTVKCVCVCVWWGGKHLDGPLSHSYPLKPNLSAKTDLCSMCVRRIEAAKNVTEEEEQHRMEPIPSSTLYKKKKNFRQTVSRLSFFFLLSHLSSFDSTLQALVVPLIDTIALTFSSRFLFLLSPFSALLRHSSHGVELWCASLHLLMLKYHRNSC